jgi:hypothetical protein
VPSAARISFFPERETRVKPRHISRTGFCAARGTVSELHRNIN